MIRFVAAFAALAAFAGLSMAKPTATPPITGIANAEDLAPLPGGRWVIASSMAGGPHASGALYAVDSKTGKATKLYPSATASGAEQPGCGAELTSENFGPHGIAYWPETGTLYVVNHGGRESVEIFDLKPGVNAAAAPSLKWRTCAIAPEKIMQNSVAPTKDGTIYVTMTPTSAMTNFAEDAGKAVGNVRSWNAAQGWRDVPGSEMPAPNGIIAKPDGSKLYVNAWSSGEIIELTLGKDGTTRRTVQPGFMPDNLRWGANGMILAAGHKLGTLKDVVTCYVSKSKTCALESSIASIEPKAFAVQCVKSVGPSFATVAAPVGKELWIGSARSEQIFRLPSNTLDPAHCSQH
jgi:hypothetical protein